MWRRRPARESTAIAALLRCCGITVFASPRVPPSRCLNSGPGWFGDKGGSSVGSSEDLESNLFGSVNGGRETASFFKKIDRVEKAHGKSGAGSWTTTTGSSQFMDSLSESFDTVSDDMDEKLKKAANNSTYHEEIFADDYKFRPDVTFRPGSTYTIRDLDLTKPGIQKSFKKDEFQTTTAEVLRKADFRNVRFLSNFITEAGIIIKRSQTKISAKAQRKVAREIKTARAFGLMPFTTMGTKPFVFGKLMKDDDMDYEYHSYNQAPSAPFEPYMEAEDPH